MARTILWWEKTVEYLFVFRYWGLDSLVMPLDGNHEKAGDTIFSSDLGKWLLIEFKRDEASCKSEIDKFDPRAYLKGCRLHKGEDDHHLLVFGEEQNGHLELRAQTYFSQRSKVLDAALQGGIGKSEFGSYLQAIVRLKKKGAGASGSPVDFSAAAVVAQSGDDVVCMSVEECAGALGIELAHLFTTEKERSRDYGHEL